MASLSGIPFLDLDRLHESIRDDLDAAYTRVLRSSGFVGASAVRPFEADFAEAHGRRAAAACASGTDALALSLRALGVGHGDEVIGPAMTFVATAEAVVHVGATPVIADVDPVSLLLGPDQVDAVRSDRTRAVVPVHLYGHVVPFHHMEQWRAEGLLVIEDAAQAHLATWDGRGVGEVGHASAFSFYPGKNLGALGDAGCVVSDDLDLVEEVRRLRDHGRSSKYEHEVIGWASRMDGLQAEFLRAKLRHLPRWTEARRRLAECYRERLGDHLVPWEDGAVHHLLVMRFSADVRRGLQKVLAESGIGVGIHYPLALSQQPALDAWSRQCRVAEAAAGEVLSLPMDPLMTEDEVKIVCSYISATP